jgi:hypothetical protein
VINIDESLLADGRVDLAPDAGEPDHPVPDILSPDLCPQACVDGGVLHCESLVRRCALGCVAQPLPHCIYFTPSNGIPPPAGNLGPDQDLTISAASATLDSCSGELDGQPMAQASFSLISQPTGCVDPTHVPRIGVLMVRSFRLNAGSTVRVTGTCALAIVAEADITIKGRLDLSAGAAPLAGPGGGAGGEVGIEAAGCGPGASGRPQLDKWPGGGGGAGSGGPSLVGGQGGYADGGAGVGCANSGLSPLVGGSGGGRGACDSARSRSGSACAFLGLGGGGGGALALVAGEQVMLELTAAIDLAGASGLDGEQKKSGGGGGGGGGALVLEAPNVIVRPDYTLDPSDQLKTGISTRGGAGGDIKTVGGVTTASGGPATDPKYPPLTGLDGQQDVTGAGAGASAAAGSVQVRTSSGALAPGGKTAPVVNGLLSVAALVDGGSSVDCGSAPSLDAGAGDAAIADGTKAGDLTSACGLPGQVIVTAKVAANIVCSATSQATDCKGAFVLDAFECNDPVAVCPKPVATLVSNNASLAQEAKHTLDTAVTGKSLWITAKLFEGGTPTPQLLSGDITTNGVPLKLFMPTNCAATATISLDNRVP